jgi:hypothetical protein
MSNSQFVIDMSKAIQEAKGDAEETVRKAILGLVKKIVDKTPVDTSQLVKSWNVALDQTDTTLHTPQSEDPLSRAIKVMDGFNLKTKQVVISNNQPYAYNIEFKGKSKLKAPQGMLRLSIIEFDQIFKGSAMTVNKGAGSKQNRYRRT